MRNVDFFVPAKWYDGVYHDSEHCCSAARSFCMVHEIRASECWLLIHGFRGYPGELVSPAFELFNVGFDIFVPRLPGHGTSGKDFAKSSDKDWVKMVENAFSDLKTRYSKVNILGHSMGCSIISLLNTDDEKMGKIIFAAPSLKTSLISSSNKFLLHLISPFVRRLKTPWKPEPRYRLHYENAPCDDTYLGAEYWSFNYTKQLLSFCRVMKKACKKLEKLSFECLVLNPLKDIALSKPSVKFLVGNTNVKCAIEDIENGTHYIFYDIDPEAENKAIDVVVKYAMSLK